MNNRDLSSKKEQNGIISAEKSEILPQPLDADEEKLILQKFVADRNGKEKEILIEHNLRQVVYIARKYKPTGMAMEELISVGVAGLIKAINIYSRDESIKFTEYISKSIDDEIKMYLKRNNIDIYIESDEKLIDEKELEFIEEAICKLPDIEREIIELRYGIGDSCENEMTQKEVAELLCISHFYVSRVEKRFIRKLRREMVTIQLNDPPKMVHRSTQSF